MVYCRICGQPNNDDASSCKSCGRQLGTERKDQKEVVEEEWSKKWNKEISAFVETTSYILAFTMIIGGFAILIEFGLKNVNGLPDGVYDFELWIIALVYIVILILYLMFNFITMNKKNNRSDP